MTEWIVTSSVLILAVVGLRAVLKGRISLRLQYGLWALVLVRLLMPFSFPSPISVMNAVPQTPILEQALGYVGYQTPDLAIAEPDTALPQTQQQEQTQRNQATYEQQLLDAKRATGTPVTLETVLLGIWIVGMAVTGTVLLCTNLHFWLRLTRNREKLDTTNALLPVYIANCVQTPCLFGVFRPSIYLTPELTYELSLRHTIAHELTHYRHLDHIWSVLRCACLVLHWYNPLVWLAAGLSKQDAELACDEAAIRLLGEDQRVSYGQTLIGMTCVKRDPKALFITATTMLTGKKSLKERIIMIAVKPRTAIYTLIAVILIAAIIAGCTFTGTPNTAPDNTEPPDFYATYSGPLPPYYTDGGMQACFVNVDGTAYVWDHSTVATLDGLDVSSVGTVNSDDISTIPQTHLSACRLDPGTKVYKGQDVGKTKYEAVYCFPCPGVNNEDHYGRFLPLDAYRGDQRFWEPVIHKGTQELTLEKLSTLIKEKRDLLSRADLSGYSCQQNIIQYWDYRLYSVEQDYRLLLISANTVADVPVLRAKLYHIDAPENAIDILTDSIADFLDSETEEPLTRLDGTLYVTDKLVRFGDGYYKLESTETADIPDWYAFQGMIVRKDAGTVPKKNLVSNWFEPGAQIYIDSNDPGTLYVLDRDGRCHLLRKLCYLPKADGTSPEDLWLSATLPSE